LSGNKYRQSQEYPNIAADQLQTETTTRSKDYQDEMEAFKTIMILFAVLAAANACCTRPTDGKCPDGSGCNVADGCFCCAYGACNIFCCNCDGGCRPSSKYSGDAAASLQRFRALNTGRSGGITFNEFKTYGDTLPHSQMMQALFNTHDLNKDGKISFEEFDEEAAKLLKSEL